MKNIKYFLLAAFGAIAITSCSNYSYQQPETAKPLYGSSVEADVPIYSNRSDQTTQHSFSQDVQKSGESSFGNGVKKWTEENKNSSFHQETKSASSGGHFTFGFEGGAN
jgi:hypothetical protein